MLLSHGVTFNVELHDGRQFKIKLLVTGCEYWEWYGWYIEEGRTIKRYLESIGVDLYKKLSWKCSYRKPQPKFN